MTWLYQVFFGTNISEGGEQKCVTKDCWDSFVKETVNPQFSSFTVYETVGFWKDKSEMTHVMLLKCNDDDDPATLSKLKQIKEMYKQMFVQENVLITRHQVKEY